MQQTPAHDMANSELLSLVPPNARRVVDVGCMMGAMARELRNRSPLTRVVGIDIDPGYAAAAARYCTRAFSCDIETIDPTLWAELFPSDCWIFGDSLEHLRDPWRLLLDIRQAIDQDGCLLVCLPNAQHWSVQWRLASGQFRYEDSGLMDRTHIRWFTRTTILEMFQATGWLVETGLSRNLPAVPMQDAILQALRGLAAAGGFDPEQAVSDAQPFQYVFRCVPIPAMQVAAAETRASVEPVANRRAETLIPEGFVSDSRCIDGPAMNVACFADGQAAPPAHGNANVEILCQTEVPVLVPCFNNPTYTARMVAQLIDLDFRNVVLIDGGSTYPAMLELLALPREGVSVIKLPLNHGPHHTFIDAPTLAMLPRYFCLTDPDLEFNPAMPRDFLLHLAELATRERIGKVGLALDISTRDAMRDERFMIGDREWQIWEWEEQFWQDRLRPLQLGGDPVYRATIDTTFALYDKAFFTPATFFEAVRVAGRFTCRHLPWYKDKGIPEAEEQFYSASARCSVYFNRTVVD